VLLLLLRVRDRWEDVWRSVVQLVLGTYMIWRARRLALCTRHFRHRAEPTDVIDAAEQPAQSARCPIHQPTGDFSALQDSAASLHADEVAAAGAAGGHQHPQE